MYFEDQKLPQYFHNVHWARQASLGGSEPCGAVLSRRFEAKRCEIFTVNWLAYGDPGSCNAFRANLTTLINQRHPEAVHIGERSGNVVGLNGFSTSNSQWENALGTTISGISAPGRSVTVIEDTSQFPISAPVCLSAPATSVYASMVTFDSPRSPEAQLGQKAVALATKETYQANSCLRPLVARSDCGDMIR